MTTSTEHVKGKIVVLGSTGGTGLQLIEQALSRNYHVVAPVRSPEKLSQIQHTNLEIVKCDIFNPDDLKKHIEGSIAVLSALGHKGIQLARITLYETSMESIIKAMRNANVKRLICVTSFYTKHQPEKYPWIYRLLIRPMLGRHFDSMSRMEEYLEKDCQDIEYTIVRPPQLLDAPLLDKEVKVCENDYFFPDYSTANKIPRANVARFILDTLERGSYGRQGIAIDMDKN